MAGVAQFVDPTHVRVVSAVGQADFEAKSIVIATGTKPAEVLEHAARNAPPAGTEARALRFTRTYGDTALTFYRHEALEAE